MKTASPLLSIITVNLNDLNGLKKTLTSIFEQTWQKFELIVIDGGSTDGSKEFVEKHECQIAYWVSEKDDGIYNGMNKGINAASGEYLLFLNSGDHFYKKETLFDVKDYLNEFSIIYFNMHIIEKNKSYIKQFPSQLSFSYFTKDTLPHQGSFIKKVLFKKVGFYDEDLKISSDWKFFIDAICKYNSSFKKINKVLCTHHLNGISSFPENFKIIQNERESHLKSSYNAFLIDLENLNNQKQKIAKLKKSISMRLLIKMKIIKKF